MAKTYDSSPPEVAPEKSLVHRDLPSQDRFASLREAYERREHEVSADRYSRLKPDSLLRVQEIERGILRLLKSKGVFDLSQKRVLEVGCGDGAWLRFLIQTGAAPENLFGVDLLPNRIREARRKCPQASTLSCEDASQLTFESESFDLLLAMTIFSSILDDHLRHLLAQEMLRVLRHGGSILWYDFHVNNPRNPDVRRVTKHEIRDLFPGCNVELHRITLAPPVARAIALTPIAYSLLSVPHLLCTHYLGWITRK
jgi:ubiquinone/menaquinone biosynthesis C-methylase UbiE